LCVILCV